MKEIQLPMPKCWMNPVMLFLMEEKHPERVGRLAISREAIEKMKKRDKQFLQHCRTPGDPESLTGIYIRKGSTVNRVGGKKVKFQISQTLKGYRVDWIVVDGIRYEFQGGAGKEVNYFLSLAEDE